MKYRLLLSELCGYVCHGSRGEPMLNEPGKLLTRAAMWASVAVVGVCLVAEAVLAWLAGNDVHAAAAISVYDVVAHVVHPIAGLLATVLFLCTAVWPRRRIPGPLAAFEQRADGA